jgi:hypothetical protein
MPYQPDALLGKVSEYKVTGQSITDSSVWRPRDGYTMVWMVTMDWYGLVWIGMDWYGLVWIGMDWYGLVWIGIDGKYTHIHNIHIY